MTTLKQSKAAVILVHGIGNITPGGVLDPAVSQASAQLGSVLVSSKQKLDAQASSINIHSQDIYWNDLAATMTEFHWSGSAGKIQKWNVFSSLGMVFALFWNLPRLGAWASTSKARHVFANIMGGLLVLSALVVTVSTVWFLAAQLEIVNKVSSSTEATLTPLFYLVCFGTLPIAGIFMSFLWFVNRRITRWGAQWIGVFTGNLLIVVYGMVFSVIVALALAIYVDFYCGPDDITCGQEDVTPLEALIAVLIVLWLIYKFMKISAGIADYCRDVVHYLAVENDGRDHRDTRLIKEELHKLIDHYIDEDYQRIVIVSHSLGTAISAEVLLERIGRDGQAHLVFDFVTSGSPLRRMLHRLLPDRIPAPSEMFRRLKDQSSFEFGRWLNLYRVLDPVGTKLLPPQFGHSKNQSSIEDKIMSPKWKWPWGHTNYWGDERFLRLLISNFLEHPTKVK